MTNFKEKDIVIIFFISISILFACISFFSLGSFGGGDTYCHYRIAKYAFHYPHFFLDLWGKPVFTLLAAPFAQFGYDGIKFFNIAVGLCAAYIAYKIVKIQLYPNAPLVIIFICFAPIYMAIMFSAMTEILLGFFIIAGAYLIIKNRYIWAAVVISFIPFVRSEGYAFILLYLIIFIIYKQYRAIPFLISGILIYSIIGFFYYQDFLWVFHQNPYATKSTLYGSGDFWFYINRTRWISGNPFAVLIAIGFVSSLILLIKKKLNIQNPLLKEFLSIHVAFIGYLFLHSFLWWQGLMAVLADDRFMSSIMPVGGIIALHGFNLVTSKIKWQIAHHVALFLTIILFVATPFYTMQFPVKPYYEAAVIIKATNWLKETNNDRFKIYYYDPLVVHELDKNPYDTSLVHERVYDIDRPEFLIEDSSILVWDAHFSANEGQLPLEKLLYNKHFIVEKYFAPDNPFNTLGGYNYEVFIFRKILNGNIDTFRNSSNILISQIINNYDADNHNNEFLDESNALSEPNSMILSQTNPYSPAIYVNMDTILFDLIKINVSVNYYLKSVECKEKFYLVVSVERDGNPSVYKAINLANNKDGIDKWNSLIMDINLKALNYKSHIIKIYTWYAGNLNANIDNLEVTIKKIF